MNVRIPEQEILTESRQPRGLCLRCRRAPSHCYCARIRAIEPRVRIALLQHPLERRNAIGTARMAHLFLKNSKLIEGVSFDGVAEVDELIDDPAHYCVVLYPGRDALEIDQGVRGEVLARFPADRKLVVFVIDGTWAGAKKMLRVSRRLSRLPQIRFSPDRPSEYRIRKQPQAYCWSSIEATHRVLEILDPSVDAAPMLETFRWMVAQQIAERARSGGPRRQGKG